MLLLKSELRKLDAVLAAVGGGDTWDEGRDSGANGELVGPPADVLP